MHQLDERTHDAGSAQAGRAHDAGSAPPLCPCLLPPPPFPFQIILYDTPGIILYDTPGIILYDTPGVLSKSMHKLDDLMMQAVRTATVNADAVVLVIDITQAPQEVSKLLLEGMESAVVQKKPTLIVLNKKDSLKPGEVAKKLKKANAGRVGRRDNADDDGLPTARGGGRRENADDDGSPTARGGGRRENADDDGSPTARGGGRRENADDGGSPTVRGGGRRENADDDGSPTARGGERRENADDDGSPTARAGGRRENADDDGSPTARGGGRRENADDDGSPTARGGGRCENADDDGSPTARAGGRRENADDDGSPTARGGGRRDAADEEEFPTPRGGGKRDIANDEQAFPVAREGGGQRYKRRDERERAQHGKVRGEDEEHGNEEYSPAGRQGEGKRASAGVYRSPEPRPGYDRRRRMAMGEGRWAEREQREERLDYEERRQQSPPEWERVCNREGRERGRRSPHGSRAEGGGKVQETERRRPEERSESKWH
ncbi:unnamed protein product [Closterium sp. NIES-64]|nr:unnamed protein product [Closterium sp. NIES-64]